MTTTPTQTPNKDVVSVYPDYQSFFGSYTVPPPPPSPSSYTQSVRRAKINLLLSDVTLDIFHCGGNEDDISLIEEAIDETSMEHLDAITVIIGSIVPLSKLCQESHRLGTTKEYNDVMSLAKKGLNTITDSVSIFITEWPIDDDKVIETMNNCTSMALEASRRLIQLNENTKKKKKKDVVVKRYGGRRSKRLRIDVRLTN